MTDETPKPPNPHPVGTPEHEGFAKALAEMQQRRTEPAPTTTDHDRMVQAFRWAIDHFYYLNRGEREQKLTLDGKEYSISEIADRVSQLDGLMPDDAVYHLSTDATPTIRQRFLETPAGKTFAAGGQCLRAMYDAEVEHKAKLGE